MLAPHRAWLHPLNGHCCTLVNSLYLRQSNSWCVHPHAVIALVCTDIHSTHTYLYTKYVWYLFFLPQDCAALLQTAGTAFLTPITIPTVCVRPPSFLHNRNPKYDTMLFLSRLFFLSLLLLLNYSDGCLIKKVCSKVKQCKDLIDANKDCGIDWKGAVW